MRTQIPGSYLKSFIICIYLSIFGASGQSAFDVYSFKIPDGYKAERTDQSLILSAPDGKLSILLLPSKPYTDIAYTEFGNDWAQYVTSKYSVLGFPNRTTSPFLNQWEMTTGQAKVFNDEVTLWIQLRNFTREGKKATILFFAVDDKQQETIKTFINDLRLNDTTSELPSKLNTTDNTGQNIGAPQNVIHEGFEIWMRIKIGAWNMSNGVYGGNYYDLSKNRMGYTILFPDGSYTGDEIPGKGFIGFSRNAPEASGYTWGKYIKQGNTLSLKSDYEDTKLVFRAADVLENSSSSFLYYKCKMVDGLRLNGSWSYVPNSENDPYYDEPGCRQVIYFKDDMTFDDRGIFVSDCNYPNRYPQDAPGKGIYSISNFTLILRYEDGRVVHKSFTGALMNDPFINNDIIYIGGNNFFRRKKAEARSIPEANQEKATVKYNAGFQTYGNFKYRIPGGWISKESPQFLELYPSSLKEKEMFSVLLLKGKTSSSSLSSELENIWNEFADMLGAQKLNQVNGKYYNEEEGGKTLAGWEYISGNGSIRSNGDFFVHAYIIRANDKTERVIVLAKEIRLNGVQSNIDPTVHHYPYYVAITDFIFNLGFVNLPGRDALKPSFRGPGVLGVWAGIGFMGGQLESTYVIFFNNGQVYYGSRFPINGLYELDTYADKERVSRYWGTYVFRDGKGTVTMPYGTFPFRIENEKLLLKPISEEHNYIRITDVDNVRLNGTWMINDENDLPATITFSPDGTFNDKGALRVLDHSLYQYYSIADGGGSGKYFIRDHSLLFNYNDGRVLMIAFPGREFTAGNQSPEKLILSFNEDILIKQ